MARRINPSICEVAAHDEEVAIVLKFDELEYVLPTESAHELAQQLEVLATEVDEAEAEEDEEDEIDENEDDDEPEEISPAAR